MQVSTQQVTDLPVKQLFVTGFCLILLLKLVLAFSLDLYSDEIFYWQASTRPALAYSDLPFMTAFLIGIGTTIGSEHAFSVRLLFLLLGSCLPLLVYWVARPLTNQQQAVESAALTLCLPLAGFLGLLAVPDVPLLCFGLLALGSFERALRTNAMTFWCLTGVAVAFGLSTHYRFFLYPLAAILYLVCWPPARSQWRNPGLWMAILIASIGLVPILWFNLTNQLSSANFYFVDRHPWTFQATGLLHVFKQAGLVTPPLYAVFLFILWQLLGKARSGNAIAALFICFSLTHLLTYLILAPWTDATSTSIHWPLSGYMPLLVFVPAALRELHGIFARRWHAVTARRILLGIPVLGFCGTLIALTGIGSQALHPQLQPLLGNAVLSNKMAGWKDFSDHTASVISANFNQQLPIIVTDNYYTAAQTEFAGLTARSYTLDQDKAVRDGRRAQLQLWQVDEAGLRELGEQPLLFISEDSTLTVPAKHELMNRLCHLGDNVDYLGELSLFDGAKRFSYYAASLRESSNNMPEVRYQPCPFPAYAWIDSPAADTTLQGTVNINGWAFNEDIGVASVSLLVDDTRVAQLDYGSARPDVVQVMQVMTDPQAPALGFDYALDTSTLPNGHHRIELEIVNNSGIVGFYGERNITIDN